MEVLVSLCRSQWLSDPRYELSSPAWSLGWSVRIPFEAWMAVYVYSVFGVVLRAGSGLAMGWSPTDCVWNCKTEKDQGRKNELVNLFDIKLLPSRKITGRIWVHALIGHICPKIHNGEICGKHIFQNTWRRSVWDILAPIYITEKTVRCIGP
jgi:hypothetical protein